MSLPNTAGNHANQGSIAIPYLTVILVWSTTPLAVVWSSESVSPVMAALLRMALAALVGSLALRLLRIPLPWHGPALRSYGYAVLGIYGAMMLTYVAARHVPSGLISLIFGLSPMVSGLLALFWLKERGFGPIKWLALLLAVYGLYTAIGGDLSLNSSQTFGVLLLLAAVGLFAASGVLIKGIRISIHPLAQTVGALWCSVPFYLLTWALIDGQLPNLDPEQRSFWAILYLALFGSLLGFVSYFKVLQVLSPTTVALVTLITPVIALMLGNLLNDEALTPALLIGAGLICLGLVLYHWGERLLTTLRSAVSNQAMEIDQQ